MNSNVYQCISISSLLEGCEPCELKTHVGGVLVNFAFSTTTAAGPLIPPNLSLSGRTKHGGHA